MSFSTVGAWAGAVARCRICYDCDVQGSEFDEEAPYRGAVVVAVPAIEDLIRTKRWSMRPRDVTDIELLEGLRRLPGSRP